MAVWHDQIYVFGVNSSKSGRGVMKFDIEADTWAHCADMLCLRFDCSAVEFEDKIYLFGGIDFWGQKVEKLYSVDCYDPVHDSWSRKVEKSCVGGLCSAVSLNPRSNCVQPRKFCLT